MPLFILRDFIPANELRYLSIADEALANGNVFTFYNHGLPYTDKPPLFFWLLMLCRRIAGNHFLWLYGIFSIVPAIIIVRILKKWTAHVIPEIYRKTSQLMLLTTGLFLALSIYLRMDMLMCMFIILSLYLFIKIINSNLQSSSNQWYFPLCVFLAVFTKGPFGFLIPFLCSTIYLLIIGKLNLFKKVWGWRYWIIFLPLCLIWFFLVYIEGGSAYISNMLLHQTAGRAVNSFHHSQPFYYYFICILYCLAPWTFAILGMMVSALKKKSQPEGIQKFFIISSLVIFILLSCISSKIEIYLLPVIPFIVYSFAISLPEYEKDKWVLSGLGIISGIYILTLPVILLVTGFSDIKIFDNIFIIFSSGCLTLSGLFSLIFLFKSDGEKRASRSLEIIASGLLCSVFFLGFSMPFLNKYLGYRTLYGAINRNMEITSIRKIKSWHVGRIENTDVYGNLRIEDITEEEYFPKHLQDTIAEPYILVTKVNKIDRLGTLQGDTIGKFFITIMGPYDSK